MLSVRVTPRRSWLMVLSEILSLPLNVPGSRLHLFYCDQYDFPLPAGHKFPLSKYRKLRDSLAGDARFQIEPAALATPEDVLRIHDSGFVEQFINGTLPAAAMRRIGFPPSPALVTRTLASVGSTLCATRAALDFGCGGTLAGGTHHAYRGEGSGFCVFNDLAIAIAWARVERNVRRAAIIDLDVHQGDGTASIFTGDEDVFTLSLHGERNFPLRKQKGKLDVPLPDGTGDAEYLAALRPALDRVFDFKPELVFLQAGVDALATDTLGRLSLTPEGIAERDDLVLRRAKHAGIPFVITLGGGYSTPIELTVAAHARTFRRAADYYCI